MQGILDTYDRSAPYLLSMEEKTRSSAILWASGGSADTDPCPYDGNGIRYAGGHGARDKEERYKGFVEKDRGNAAAVDEHGSFAA